MPAPTPQTAQRKIRSQSPPRLTNRWPVIQMHIAIAASSVRPYMWIVSGPRSTAPLDGDGIEARRLMVGTMGAGLQGRPGFRNAQCGILPARPDASLPAGILKRLTP